MDSFVIVATQLPAVHSLSFRLTEVDFVPPWVSVARQFLLLSGERVVSSGQDARNLFLLLSSGFVLKIIKKGNPQLLLNLWEKKKEQGEISSRRAKLPPCPFEWGDLWLYKETLYVRRDRNMVLLRKLDLAQINSFSLPEGRAFFLRGSLFFPARLECSGGAKTRKPALGDNCDNCLVYMGRKTLGTAQGSDPSKTIKLRTSDLRVEKTGGHFGAQSPANTQPAGFSFSKGGRSTAPPFEKGARHLAPAKKPPKACSPAQAAYSPAQTACSLGPDGLLWTFSFGLPPAEDDFLALLRADLYGEDEEPPSLDPAETFTFQKYRSKKSPEPQVNYHFRAEAFDEEGKQVAFGEGVPSAPPFYEKRELGDIPRGLALTFGLVYKWGVLVALCKEISTVGFLLEKRKKAGKVL